MSPTPYGPAGAGREGLTAIRVDKWLWAARFFKTRSLACEALDKGRVAVNGITAKPSRELRVGDTVVVRHDGCSRTVVVRALDDRRGPAPAAQCLYRETEESLLARENWAAMRRLAPEPALTRSQGRPTKRDRRHSERLQAGWDDRWSARWAAGD